MQCDVQALLIDIMHIVNSDGLLGGEQIRISCTFPLHTERTHSTSCPVSSWNARQRFISWSHSFTAPPSLVLKNSQSGCHWRHKLAGTCPDPHDSATGYAFSCNVLKGILYSTQASGANVSNMLLPCFQILKSHPKFRRSTRETWMPFFCCNMWGSPHLPDLISYTVWKMILWKVNV